MAICTPPGWRPGGFERAIALARTRRSQIASAPRAIYVDGGVTLYPGFETGG